MKTTWNYSLLAEGYRQRPDYSSQALDRMFKEMQLKENDCVCDLGAGIGHLSIPLLKAGFHVTAVEPNDAMRTIGIERTENYEPISWVEATAEDSKQPSSSFEAVTFGSSFNVCDKQKALEEAFRIIKPQGWFACLWNHRDLSDSIQNEIEQIIKNYKTDYDYGDRRQDQTQILKECPFLYDPVYISEKFQVEQSLTDVIEAWRSHGTLQRQVGIHFDRVIEKIAAFLTSLGKDKIFIPYETKIWVAQFQK